MGSPRKLDEDTLSITLHWFYMLSDNDNKEAETAGEEMIWSILYLENSDKARFSDLNKRVENDYVLNKSEYPRTITAVQSLLLKYKPNYNSNRKYQYEKKP